jgi:hypothetical protein
LTSKGIKLNSDPEETGEKYYLEIGDLENSDKPDASYIKYDKDGSLQMKVSSFELTGSSNPNLLNNTSPIEDVDSSITHVWWGASTKKVINSEWNEKCVGITNRENDREIA